MRFQVAMLVVACVGALLACETHATQLKSSADQRALLRTSLAVAEEKFSIKKAAKQTGGAVSNVGETVGAPIAKAMSNFDGKILVNSLTVAGNAIKNQLDKLVCNNDAGLFAVTLSCSLALTSAICTSTNNFAPGCIPAWKAPFDKIVTIIGLSAIMMILRCTFFHVLRQLPGLCEGRAYGIAQNVANLAVKDPYSSACSLTIGCSCGPDSCAFACANDASVCYGSAYTDAFEDMLDVFS